MELDLNARNSKWKQEQTRRRDQAKQRVRLEQQRRAAALKAKEEMEELKAQKRRERLEQLALQEQQALEEQRLTGGIKYMAQLRPTPTAGTSDKITLPVSALEQLNPQNALDLGVFTFELSYTWNGVSYVTHAGVVEFIAPEGTVGVPPKVAASLFRSSAADSGEEKVYVPPVMQVRFVRLEKGTFARLQPRGEGFGDRQLDLKQLLERTLQGHTTLTVGDVIFVRHGKRTFEVNVMELQPEEKVNVLNTDLEVAFLPSEAVSAVQERKRQQEAAVALAEAQERMREERQHQLMAALTPEPSMEDQGQVRIVLRLRNRSPEARRFLHESTLGSIFMWVEALTGDDPKSFQLAAQYPRRIFSIQQRGDSLACLGFNGRQETLFVERVEDLRAEVEAEGVVEEQSNAKQEGLGGVVQSIPLPDEWAEARAAFEHAVDEALTVNESVPVHGLEPVMPVIESSDVETKWKAQLGELRSMGFTNTQMNIQLLERYQGRLLRVVNYLSEASAAHAPNDASTVAVKE